MVLKYAGIYLFDGREGATLTFDLFTSSKIPPRIQKGILPESRSIVFTKIARPSYPGKRFTFRSETSIFLDPVRVYVFISIFLGTRVTPPDDTFRNKMVGHEIFIFLFFVQRQQIITLREDKSDQRGYKVFSTTGENTRKRSCTFHESFCLTRTGF